MNEERAVAVAGVIEESLAGHPAFGDTRYIHDQLRSCLGYYLGEIASRASAAGELLAVWEQTQGDALDHVVGDTVLRCAIIHGHIQAVSGASRGLPLEMCEEIFAAAVR